MRIGIIGCGGTGGWLATLFAKTLMSEDKLILIDADKFERRNRDRQLACKVGDYKCEALAKHLRRVLHIRAEITPKSEYLTESNLEELAKDTDILICAADNHPARLRTLTAVDLGYTSQVIICGNEHFSAEAYVYRPEFRDTGADPVVYYPELLEDMSGDPTHESCTGEVLDSTPQLAIANMTAAVFAARLLHIWTEELARLESPVYMKNLPIRLWGNELRNGQVLLRDTEGWKKEKDND